MSLVLKLFCIPKAFDNAAQLRIRSFPSSNHMTSDLCKFKISFQLLHTQAKKYNLSLFIYRLAFWSGFGLGPRYSLNVTSRCLPNGSVADDTENSDKSVETLSVSDLNIRHETDKACGIGFWVVIFKYFGFSTLKSNPFTDDSISI